MRVVFGLLIVALTDGVKADAECYQRDMNIPGYHLTTRKNVLSASECQAECEKTTNCKYFSFAEKTNEERRVFYGDCYLKKTDLKTDSDFISGDADCTGQDCYKQGVFIDTGNAGSWIDSGSVNIVRIKDVANDMECQKHCAKTKFCKRFSFYKKELHLETGQVGWPGDCILIAPEHIPWTGVVSADKSCGNEQCLKKNVNSAAFHNRELRRPDGFRYVGTTKTALDCGAKCNTTAGCERFSFVEAKSYHFGFVATKGMCFVKSSASEEIEEIGITSGPAECPGPSVTVRDAGADGCFLEDTEFFTVRGKWFRDANRKVDIIFELPDVETCHQRCKETEMCDQFIFASALSIKKLPFFNTGDCLLIADLYAPLPGVVSGPKTC